MPGEQGKAEVRPIYRKGDRVLVELPFGYCDVIVEGCEVEGGRLRLYGVCGALPFFHPKRFYVSFIPTHPLLVSQNVLR